MSVFLRGALPIKEGVDFESLRIAMMDNLNFTNRHSFYVDMEAQQNQAKPEFEDVRLVAEEYKNTNGAIVAMVGFLDKLHVTHFSQFDLLKGATNYIVLKQKVDMPLEYVKVVLKLLAGRLLEDGQWNLEFNEIGNNNNVLVFNRVSSVEIKDQRTPITTKITAV